MPGRSCYFYADESDLLDLLEAFKEFDDYKYVQMRSELNETTKIYHDPSKVLPEALASPGKPYRTHSFLIMEKEEEIFDRDIVLEDGSGIRKWIDQNHNWNSIVIALGGDAGDQTIIMSDINTVGDTDKAVEMHKKFKKLIMSKTKKVGAKGTPYRLMPGAAEKLKSGWHLTQNRVWKPGVEEIKLSDEEIAAL